MHTANKLKVATQSDQVFQMINADNSVVIGGDRPFFRAVRLGP